MSRAQLLTRTVYFRRLTTIHAARKRVQPDWRQLRVLFHRAQQMALVWRANA